MVDYPEELLLTFLRPGPIQCPGCGWQFPAVYQRLQCIWCGHHLVAVTELTEERKKVTGKRARYKMRWQMALLTKLSRSLPPRAPTELEWLEACDHFNGCSLCHEPATMRVLVVPAKQGGKYTPWNIIPACDNCSKDLMGNLPLGKATFRGGNTVDRDRIAEYLINKGEQECHQLGIDYMSLRRSLSL